MQLDKYALGRGLVEFCGEGGKTLLDYLHVRMNSLWGSINERTTGEDLVKIHARLYELEQLERLVSTAATLYCKQSRAKVPTWGKNERYIHVGAESDSTPGTPSQDPSEATYTWDIRSDL